MVGKRSKYQGIIILVILLFILTNRCDLFILHKLITYIMPESAGFVYSNTDEYYHGNFVILTATSYKGYSFDHWEINGKIIKTDNPLIINMDEDKIINTYFIHIDKEVPVITQFGGPLATDVKEISIFLDGFDNIGIIAWLITESAIKPDVYSPYWESTKPTRYYFNRSGAFTLYAWAKDDNGNISESKSLGVTVKDYTSPLINKIIAPSLTAKPEINLTLSGSDNFSIIYWLVTETSLIPNEDNSDWKIESTYTYQLTKQGTNILYVWAKDSSGNISGSKTVVVVYDAIKPVITKFTAPDETTSFSVPVAISGTDNRGISGWQLTNKPGVLSSSWEAVPPTVYNLPAHGENIIYAWAKDEAGNISDPVTIKVVKSYMGAWTIMVWMDADNNLEYNAMNDLNEMEYGLYEAKLTDPDVEDKLAVIVQIDRIDGYDSGLYDDGPDWSDTRRYLMRAQADPFTDKKITSYRLDKDNGLGEVNMGDVSNLRSFIDYCKMNFPAEHYGLLLWNHGGGVRNILPVDTISVLKPGKEVCWDKTNNNDVLYIGELTDPLLPGSLTDTEDVEFIGFDACSMGMLEIAYEYRPGAGKFGTDYLIGSPANIQVDGWEYNKIFKRLKGAAFSDNEGDACYDINSITAAQWAGIFVKEYKDAFNNLSAELLAAFDLSEVENVKSKLDALSITLQNSEELAESVRNNNTDLTMNYFDERYLENWINYPHFDLYDFANRIANNRESPILSIKAAAELKAAVDACVIASWGGADYRNFTEGKNGLGFFFPDGKKTYAQQYWYTGMDIFHQSGLYYGNLDFCNTNSDGNVQNWKELLEFWYDRYNTITPEETW